MSLGESTIGIIIAIGTFVVTFTIVPIVKLFKRMTVVEETQKHIFDKIDRHVDQNEKDHNDMKTIVNEVRQDVKKLLSKD